MVNGFGNAPMDFNGEFKKRRPDNAPDIVFFKQKPPMNHKILWFVVPQF